MPKGGVHRKRDQSKRTRKLRAPSIVGPPKPWDHDPAWSVQHAEAYCAYRGLGPKRSLSQAAKQLGKSEGMLRRWSMDGGWVARAAAWDRECDRRKAEDFAQENQMAAVVLAERAGLLEEALLEPAKEATRRIAGARAEGKDPFEGLDLAELLRLSASSARAFAQVSQVERLARGLSTHNVGGHDGGPIRAEVARKSTEEIEAYLLGRLDERQALERRAEETTTKG